MISGERAPVAVALVHWPVLDKQGEKVCTNVTSFDLHDISRLCRSYGVEKYFVVNRMHEQLMYVSRVVDHWCTGSGKKYNPLRKTALALVEGRENLPQAVKAWRPEALVVGTTARDLGEAKAVRFRQLKSEIHSLTGRPVLLVFGTGYGLHEDVMKSCDAHLEPIWGAAPDYYRHLSVRSAVSICLDRLLGAW